MSEIILIILLFLVIVAVAAIIGPKIGLASPLLLVGCGLAISLIPEIATPEIDPEWILEGLLPPLLYAAAVSMPTMNFRREFRAIGGLSVILVVISALAVGLLFTWLIPELGFVWGVALGAIVSPTDAAAVAIVKKTKVGNRAIVLLEGESLLNDATALVLVRTAIVAASTTFSFWGAVGSFARSVAIAVIIGAFVGWVNVKIRSLIPDPTVNTIISFTVPFVASIPTESLDGSGLVAAVVAGLVTSYMAPHLLPPQHRMSDQQNWASVELVLEGAIFLFMGLQISSVFQEVNAKYMPITIAVLLPLATLGTILAIRGVYVWQLLQVLTRRTASKNQKQARLQAIEQRIGSISTDDLIDNLESRELIGSRKYRVVHKTLESQGSSKVWQRHDSSLRARLEKHLERTSKRVTRALSDIDYLAREQFGYREGVLVTWAGMRGAITVATAETLPATTPHRPLIVFIAFMVALLSLLLQGMTVGPLAKWLYRNVDDSNQETIAGHRQEIEAMLDSVTQGEISAQGKESSPGNLDDDLQLAVLKAQREALLEARDDGKYDAAVLSEYMKAVDAKQIFIEMRDI